MKYIKKDGPAWGLALNNPGLWPREGFRKKKGLRKTAEMEVLTE